MSQPHAAEAVELASAPALAAQTALQPTPAQASAAVAPAGASASGVHAADAEVNVIKSEVAQAAKADSGVETVSPSAYLDLLQKYRSVWTEQPDVTISWEDLAYTVQVPVTDTKVHTLLSAVVDMAKKPFLGSKGSTILRALQPSSGRIRPASMTLVLAPPGHGKTTLLKALSGRLSHDKCLTGAVRYNNLTQAENMEHGVHTHRLAAFVSQSDLLFPTLTVTETLRFAAQSSLPDPALLLKKPNLSEGERQTIRELATLEETRAEMLIQMLGLSECANTIVGNDLLRGVSGGQKKRVGLGEMLLTNARAFFLDEVSTGLDAAVTLHIFSALKQACAINRSSVVVALLQPTPETYALFDDILLLRDGHVVYHGPREAIPEWLWEVAGLEVPHGVDEAGFLVDYLSDPQAQYDAAAKAAGILYGDRKPTPENSSEHNRSSLQPGAKPAPALPAPVAAIVPSSTAAAGPLGNEGRSRTPSYVRVHLGNADESQDVVPAALVAQAAGNESAALLPHVPQQMATTPVVPFSGDSNRAAANVVPATPVAAVVPRQKGLQHGMSSSSFAPMYHSRAGASPVTDADELAARYKASTYHAAMATELGVSKSTAAPLDAARWDEYTRASYATKYPHSTARHTALNLSRQLKLTVRNRTMVPPRLAQCVIMGVVFGTLFIQLGYNKFADRMGLLLYVIMTGAFANLTELPVASEARNVISKQIDAGFFPASSYSVSVAALHWPITLLELLIFGCMIYWIPGFVAEADRFFFFMLVLWLNSNALSVFFRSISYVAKNPDIARQLDMPFIIIFIIFGGFLIVFDKIPRWLLFLFYGTPFGWGVRSLAQNEFKSSKYDNIGVTGERDGDVFLSTFGVFTDDIWKWMGVLYLGCFYLIFLSVNALLLRSLKPVTPMGTRKTIVGAVTNNNGAQAYNGTSDALAGPLANGPNGVNAEQHTRTQPEFAGGAASDALGLIPATSSVAQAVHSSNMPVSSNPVPVSEHAMAAADGSVAIPMKTLKGNKQSFQLTALPFTPVTLAWRNINYTVDIPPSKRGEKATKRQLLRNISGFAAPGRMTALMGSSGAGKTTLMDVIAGRKTTGQIEGQVLVNGHPKDPASFDKLTGYVEQQDIHIGTATVRESLLFSAKLRLPLKVDERAREVFVDEVMALVGLSSIANRLVGDAALPGLSQGQLKLVTIAVELVANPSVIFLDEPTSGLDAPSAARVMKAVRRIAATGRTVLCTIHQPSEELFYFFDRLLLLKSGGSVVFQSEIGRKGRHLVNYFEEASEGKQLLPRGSVEILPNGKKKVHLRQSPANWMLDVIGASGQHTAEQADYAQLWTESKLAAETQRDIDAASEPRSGSKAIVLNDVYASGLTRYLEVQKRLYVSHWRNPPMNVTRVLLLLIFAIVLGIVYLDISTDDYGGVQSALSVIFLAISFPSSICAGSSLPTFFRQRAVYYRETTIGLYGYKSFQLAIFMTELPYLAMAVFIFLVPFYFLVGFAADARLFFEFWFMSFLMTILYSGLASLWLALLPNQIAANVANGILMNLFFMFGGLFIKPSSIPAGWKWFYYIDPVPKAFTAVAMGQFYCDEGVDPTCPRISEGGAPSQGTYSYLTELLQAHASDYGAMVGWLVLEIVVVRIFVLLALKFVSHIKR